jgi:hypothetical protein
MSGQAPDLEALLVALVLAPATYSRNRFFEMYTDPAVRRVRRRAALVRSIVQQLVLASSASPPEKVSIAVRPAPGGHVELTYSVASMGLRRTTWLDPMEAALVRFAMARAQPLEASSAEGVAIADDDPDRLRIEAALRSLAPLAALGHHAGRHQSAPHDPIV